jgi:hypothetical protein
LPSAPGELLDYDAAGFLMDPAHAVEEKHHGLPNRDELKRTLEEVMVAGRRQPEQMALDPTRGRTQISRRLPSSLGRAWW